MMKSFFSKFRQPRCAVPFTAHRHTSPSHSTHKRLRHEQLEPRMMLSVNPTSADFLVNDVVHGFQSVGENVSSVAVSETAGMIVVYSGLGAGKRDSILLRKYDLDGVAQSNEAERVSTTIRGARSNAVVAANEAGSSVVVWQGRGQRDKYGIYLQRFDANGVIAGDEQLVNVTVGGKQIDPAVAMAADGSFVVSWSGPSSADFAGIFAQRFNADGTSAGGEELVNTTTTNDQIESDVAVNSRGDYVITWSSRLQDSADWGVFGQRFNSAGERQGDEFQVNTTTAASQRESSVALQNDGTFMVVWSSFGQDGDSWAVVAQRFDAAGAAVGDEFIVNTTTSGHQRHAQVAGAGGKYLVTWQSGVADGSGWEVMAQEFGATGNRVGSEQTVNTGRSGANSGHQQHPAAALNAAGNGAVVWSGYGATDRQGVFGRSFQDDDVQSELNLTPDLATISDQTVSPSGVMTVTVTATDPNAGDTLTYQLSQAPAGATIVRNDNNTATITWTPSSTDANSVVNFIVLVTDNGEPPLADAEEFQVTVTDGNVGIDLNGPNESGTDATAQFAIGLGAASIVNNDLKISEAANGTISQTTVILTDTPNGSQEILEVDTAGTNITASYLVGLRRLLLSGVDTSENYEQVLKTLRYNNTAANPSGTRTVAFGVNDTDGRLSNNPTITIDIVTAEDLVGFAQALEESETEFFGAAWCPACTAQKELFEDGGQFLPFTEVTNSDRSRNTVGDTNNINFFPTWVFPDGTRLEGEQTLETIAQRSGVSIPLSVDPFFAPIDDTTLLVGSPLHIPLDGYDPTGGPLTYTVTTNNSAVKAEILSGNRSARINVAGFGDMVFELFEQRASRPTDRFIELANDDFFDDIIFHRVIDDFVIQGGDPLGTGTGGSTLGDFDDQFHVDLQHNRSGLLSYAKSSDDTNDSQFFVTEGASRSLRNLDFNHSVFGVLVEGESNRAAISDTALNGERPVFDVVMENVEIFEDTENAVLFLKADPGTTGDVTVTVTVEDQQGNTFDREFTLTMEQDQDDLVEQINGITRRPFNGRPFLGDIAQVTIAPNTSAQIQLTATDVEGDAFVFSAVKRSAGNYTLEVSDSGLITVTPETDFVGTLQIEARVRRVNPTGSTDLDLQLITIEVVA